MINPIPFSPSKVIGASRRSRRTARGLLRGINTTLAYLTFSWATLQAAEGLAAWQALAMGMAGDPVLEVASGPGVWAAVTESGDLLRSTNAVQWERWTVPPADRVKLYSVACSQDRLVGVGRHSPNFQCVAASLKSDGTEPSVWLKPTPPSILWVVRFLNDEFVAAGDDGHVFRSLDGVTWIAAEQIPTGSSSVRGLAYGKGRYLALELQASRIWSSTNLQQWSATSIPLGTWQGLTFGGGKFVAVGSGGKVLWSEDGQTWCDGGGWLSADVCGLDPLRLSDGHADGGRFLSAKDRRYRLDATANLQQWSELATVTGPGGVAHVPDLAADTESARSYRLTLLP